MVQKKKQKRASFNKNLFLKRLNAVSVKFNKYFTNYGIVTKIADGIISIKTSGLPCAGW